MPVRKRSGVKKNPAARKRKSASLPSAPVEQETSNGVGKRGRKKSTEAITLKVKGITDENRTQVVSIATAIVALSKMLPEGSEVKLSDDLSSEVGG